MRCRVGSGVRLRRAAFGLPLVLLATISAQRAEADFAYDLNLGVSETDNIRLTPSNRRAETVTNTGFDVSLHEDRRWFYADVTGDLAYLDYLRGTYSPGVVGNLMALSRLNIIQDRFNWSFSDNFGQSQVNPLAPVTPTNRENVNYFSTGPDLTLPMGSLAEFLADARYSNVNYQITPLSSNRYTGGVGVRRDLSSSSSVSLNVSDELIRFDNAQLNANYDQQEGFLRYIAHGVRTRLDVQLGVARLKFQDTDATTTLGIGGVRVSFQPSNDTTTSPLIRVAATRQLSPFNSLTLTAGREISDAGDDFRLLQALGGQNLLTQAVSPTSSPFKNTYATLGWGYLRTRTSVGATVGYYKQSYFETLSLNENRLTGEAHINRGFTPTLDGTAAVSWERDQFPNVVGNATQLNTTLILRYRATQRFTLTAEYDHTRRESAIESSNFQDNILFVKLQYGRPVQPQVQTGAPKLPLIPAQSGY